MKASVQYNDLLGSSAADVSDYYQSSLQNYLVKTYAQYDGDRYVCKGCTIWVSGQQVTPQGNIAFVCYDKVEDKYVKFYPEIDLSLNDIFSLFKRFEVVLGNKLESVEVNSDDNLDLK